MIKTFYGLGTLDSSGAFFASLVIGFFFGLALERAGFGSSRRLAGIFYFRDMAVLKVMSTAMLTAMIGLYVFEGLGLIDPSTEIYYMLSYYGTYQMAGLIFGVGFVMGGWCPGTSAVGIASGKIDAMIFFVGAIIGSILFNEIFSVIKPLYQWGESSQENFGQPGLAFVYKSLCMPKPLFTFLFTLIAVGCFWGSEMIEQKKGKSAESGKYFNTPFLKSFSAIFIMLAGTLFLFPSPDARIYESFSNSQTPTVRLSSPTTANGSTKLTDNSQRFDQAHRQQPTVRPSSPTTANEKELLESIEAAEDHVEPEELADALYNKNLNFLVIDVRSKEEYNRFHIRGAVNVQLPDLPDFAAKNTDKSMIVLYSNGMTHPAQARDSLFRMGYRNLYILTDGLNGFIEQCLKPVSLRKEPISQETADKINAWRAYFYGEEKIELLSDKGMQGSIIPSKLINTGWLAEHLGEKGIKIIDSRDQPDYNRSHIPDSLAVSCESFRGVVDGVPSLLLPANILAERFSLMGIEPEDTVILVYGADRVRDAALIAMAFERLGHKNYAILDGGFDKWAAEGKAISTDLPSAHRSDYPTKTDADHFTLDYKHVLAYIQNKSAIILDVRPEEYFTGKKSDEARAGHIPGAINRDFKEDLSRSEAYSGLKPKEELEAAYAKLIPSKNTKVIIHCRTGHQASQTFFVLKHILGYTNLFWYDAGWTEWAARKELPVEIH